MSQTTAAVVSPIADAARNFRAQPDFVLFRTEQYSRKCKILPTESICVSRAEGFNIIELFAFLLCAVCSVNAYIILHILQWFYNVLQCFYNVLQCFYNVCAVLSQCIYYFAYSTMFSSITFFVISVLPHNQRSPKIF